MIDIQVQNGDVLIKLLRKYPDKARRAIRKGAKKGCELIAAVARANIPQVIHHGKGGEASIGNLRRAVKVLPIKRSRSGSLGYRVAVDGEGLGYTGDEFYAAFVEWGHGQGKRSGAVIRAQRRGDKATLERIDTRQKVEGKHYFKNAADETETAAIDLAQAVILAELNK